MTTANSSPPNRPHNSLSVMINCNRRATCANNRSPTGCPNVSFTALNRSRSIIRKPQRRRHWSASFNAFAIVSVSNSRLGKPVKVSKRARCEILFADSRCSVTSEPTPRKPRKPPSSECRGEADNSHQCWMPLNVTGTIRLLKDSRRLRRSANSCSSGGYSPNSQASPAMSFNKGCPSTDFGSVPSA